VATGWDEHTSEDDEEFAKLPPEADIGNGCVDAAYQDGVGGVAHDVAPRAAHARKVGHVAQRCPRYQPLALYLARHAVHFLCQVVSGLG